MRKFRQVSVSDTEIPPAMSTAALPPDLQVSAVRLITRAEAMGLIPSDELPAFSIASLDAAMQAFATAGIGRGISQPTDAGDDLGNALELMNFAVEESPHPAFEWSSMMRVLTPTVLGNLLGISEYSLHRYSTNETPTPWHLAVRLHWLAMRVADLTGAYNQYGIIRWFDRPRRALAGETPAQRLTGNWSPDDQQVIEVAGLAAHLTVMSTT